MSRTHHSPALTLVSNHAKQEEPLHKTASVVAIMPLQEGLFAWIVEPATRPRPFKE